MTYGGIKDFARCSRKGAKGTIFNIQLHNYGYLRISASWPEIRNVMAMLTIIMLPWMVIELLHGS